MIYSPSQTNEFAFCPQARQFYVEGWQNRIAGKPEIAAWMGVAMGAGLEAYYQGRTKALWVLASAELVGATSWAQQVATFREAGGVVEDSDIASVPGLLAKALAKYPKIDPIPPDWEVLATEYTLEHAGKARIDLLVETSAGVAVVDFKWKKDLYVKAGETKDQARGRTLLEYENYWNMLHYMWGLRADSTWSRVKLDPAYYIILGELSPPHVTMQRFEVDPRVLEQWEHTAKLLWMEMVGYEDETLPRGNTTHRNQYGLCKFYNACFTHFLDRERMKTQYVQIERRPRAL